jgi:hypothetical protein
MKRRTFLSCAACLPPSLAADSLFDGKTFRGWRDPSRLSPAGDSWAIDGGAFMARRDPQLLEDLVTTTAYGNFDLEFAWRLDAAGNSGVKYCIVEEVFFENTEPGWVKGKRVGARQFSPGTRGQVYLAALELQLIDDAAHPDAQLGADRRTGALYGAIAPERPARLRKDWNEGRLVRTGMTVEHWINGERLLAYQLTDLRVAARWQRSESRKAAFAKAIHEPRPIALQNHGDSSAWFRGLRLRG